MGSSRSARQAPPGDAKRDVLSRFVRRFAETSCTAIKAAGYTDAQLVDISLAFAIHAIKDVFNRIDDTEIDLQPCTVNTLTTSYPDLSSLSFGQGAEFSAHR
jgi:hypothetical protein